MSHRGRPATDRDRLFVSSPALWPVWPFLPVVRAGPGGEECGLLYDALHAAGRAGFSATVFLCNLFELPPTAAEFLASPRKVYDTVGELLADGWRVD
jgi:hypothetical protein